MEEAINTARLREVSLSRGCSRSKRKTYSRSVRCSGVEDKRNNETVKTENLAVRRSMPLAIRLKRTNQNFERTRK